MEYPTRPSHYAHRYCRLLAASAANDINALGCWLCTVIAHLEDSRRYTGRSRLFNEQWHHCSASGNGRRWRRPIGGSPDHGWLASRAAVGTNQGTTTLPFHPA